MNLEKSVGGYLDPVKRNIRAIKLRGVKSDGFIMPLSSLESFGDITKLKMVILLIYSITLNL